MRLQLVFELFVVGSLPVSPSSGGVVVTDVPELAGGPTVAVERVRDLRVVVDSSSI